MTGQRAPRPLPLPRPPPRRPRPRLPAPGRESAAGRPDPPKGPEAGAPGFQGPGEGPPAARWPQVQSIDTAPRGEGAPSFSRAWPPGRSGPRPSLASDPAPGRGAARGPCSPEGGFGRWKERPVGGRVGRRGRPRSRSGNQVAGAVTMKGHEFSLWERHFSEKSVSVRRRCCPGLGINVDARQHSRLTGTPTPRCF
ncbi:translation initiation factor IF-2-like isoform X2 [Equus quagga]|uniref:translation initiation factor IF-2-like isoform X2 n=1 Tax=Equus quagga TaxID=89248 RepID=UPI001EE36E88|nr:translation initiation factor IF-2-like isoform X2 [Equus quagga]